MKKRLLIVGAGGFGREVFNWAKDLEKAQSEWYIYGFIDDNTAALSNYDYPVPIIGTTEDYLPVKQDAFVMAIGDPRKKLEIAAKLEERGANFITIIHPSAVIGVNVDLGRGCVICPYAVITCDVKLGNFVTVNVAASIGHDASLGNGCTLSGHSDVTGYCLLGTGVFLGSHASIIPSVKVGNFARIGAGSVVVKDIKDGVTVIGVPAKKL